MIMVIICDQVKLSGTGFPDFFSCISARVKPDQSHFARALQEQPWWWYYDIGITHCALHTAQQLKINHTLQEPAKNIWWWWLLFIIIMMLVSPSFQRHSHHHCHRHHFNPGEEVWKFKQYQPFKSWCRCIFGLRNYVQDQHQNYVHNQEVENCGVRPVSHSFDIFRNIFRKPQFESRYSVHNQICILTTNHFDRSRSIWVLQQLVGHLLQNCRWPFAKLSEASFKIVGGLFQNCRRPFFKIVGGLLQNCRRPFAKLSYALFNFCNGDSSTRRNNSNLWQLRLKIFLL